MDAIIYLSIFGGSVMLSAIIRNFYIYYGYVMALEMRKTVISAMYDKVTKLSMRSLTETNSGKLIAIVSSDIFTLERPFSVAPFVLAAPFIHLYCYMLIWYVAGWPYAIIVASMWDLTYLLQMCTANLQKKMKQTEAMRNDERIKLINDMVTGIRTIKSYAWENHYIEKVRVQRAEQMKYIFWLNLVGSMGFSLFQNIGLLAVLAIFLPKWYLGEQLELGDSFALVAMIYYLFFSVNGLTYYSMTTIQQALAVAGRLSEVFRMEEYKRSREEQCVSGQPVIKLDKMDYAWGFRVADNQADVKKSNKAKLALEIDE